MDQNFDRPLSPDLKPLEYGAFLTCLKRAGKALVLLGCVLKRVKIFGQIQPPQSCRQKWAKILVGLFSQNLKPLEKSAFPTCLKIAEEGLGLLGCVLKRPNILVKFNHRGLVGKNGPKF